MLNDFTPKDWLNCHRGQHLSGLPDEVVTPYIEVGKEIGSPMTQGIIFDNGGAISRVEENATAASNRSAPYMGHPIACWDSPTTTNAVLLDTEDAALPPRATMTSLASSRLNACSEPVTTMDMPSRVRGVDSSTSSRMVTPARSHLSTMALCQSESSASNQR